VKDRTKTQKLCASGGLNLLKPQALTVLRLKATVVR